MRPCRRVGLGSRLVGLGPTTYTHRGVLLSAAVGQAKIPQRGHRTLLRSQSPDGVVQEIYGLLITHQYLQSQRAHAALHRRHRAAEVKKFLIRIDNEVPAQLQIHLLCDEYGTHNTPAIKTWPAKHPRFQMHFTPTGSSWINQAERWFGFLADRKIRRGAGKNVPALEADIRTWAKDWSEDHKPFIWTKTAEEILDSLARFCQRISGAGHQGNCLPARRRRRRFPGWGRELVARHSSHAQSGAAARAGGPIGARGCPSG
ncbi:transposase [Streptomyces sp. NBC_00996]|uniref:transposase n=1 Tax=Streptomyces sp. NBC_00996 TaxID=2903710 RepID=UPI0038640A4A|nr:transposase [Streptomyces sp. NBC_00996]